MRTTALPNGELNASTELKESKWFRVLLFSAMRGVVNVVTGTYGLPPLSRPLSWLYNRFHISRFYRDALTKLGCTQSEE